MKKVLIIALLTLFLSCITTKKTVKNVWKAEKATFSYPGSTPPEPKDTTSKRHKHEKF